MPKLIIDANTVVVFVIGSIDPKLLGVAKRVKEYRQSDYDLIYSYLTFFSDVILLPNTITEASNLLDHLRGERRQDCMEFLASLVSLRTERYIPSTSAVVQPEYVALGVTDAAILCALKKDVYLLTADRELFLAAIYRGHEAQYFEDLRSQ